MWILFIIFCVFGICFIVDSCFDTLEMRVRAEEAKLKLEAEHQRLAFRARIDADTKRRLAEMDRQAK